VLVALVAAALLAVRGSDRQWGDAGV